MSISQNNGKYAGWIDEFISAFSKKTASTVEADINIKDLDEVMWNEEKYRVMFDENGANIINEFGNTVTTLEGVKTLEEVDDRLSKKQIITESIDISNEVEAEINEAMKYIDNSKSLNYSYPTKEEIAELVTIKTAAILNEKFADFEDKMISKFDESKFEPIKNKQLDDKDEFNEGEFNDEFDEDEFDEDEFDPMKDIMYDDPDDEFENQTDNFQNDQIDMQQLEQKITDIIDSKINYMVDQVINQVTQKLSQLQIPSQNVMDIEKQQYDKSAEETMEQINNENNTDRTTPEGFFNNHKDNDMTEDESNSDVTFVDNKRDKGVNIPSDKDIDMEVERSLNESEDIIKTKDNKPERSTLENDSIEEDFVDDEIVEKDIDSEASADPLLRFRKSKNIETEVEAEADSLSRFKKRVKKIADYEEDLTPSTINDFAPNGQSQQDNNQQQNQDPQQQMQQEQKNIQNVQDPNNQDQNNQNQQNQNEIVGSDAEIFKTAVCPFCANKLYTESKDEEYLNISCGSCSTKYKVNLNNEKIYIK